MPIGNRAPFISVMGTIGSGKTTAVSLLAQHCGWEVLPENFDHNAFLPRFYQDPSRWAFHSQTFFLMEKITQVLSIKTMGDRGTIIQDVPIYQDVFGYAQTLYEQGSMESAEWKLYLKIFHTYADYLPKPDLIIYLKASLPVVQERIKKRGREYELSIPESYLKRLQKHNERWVHSNHAIDILTISTDTINLVRSVQDQHAFIHRVEQRIAALL